MRRTKTHRSRLAAWIGALAAALVLVSPASSPAAKTLSIHAWANHLPPRLLARFEAETGIDIALQVFDSDEVMLARLLSGDITPDLVLPSDYVIAEMIELGIAERIDTAEMDSFAGVVAPHDAPPYDPERAYSAPYMWGTTGFTYSPAATGGPLEDSWSELFEPRPSLEGQVAMLADEVEVYSAAAHFLGVDACTENATDAERIGDLLTAQAPRIAGYFSDDTTGRLKRGEVAVHMQWSGAARRVRMPPAAIAGAVYVRPREGVVMWADGFVVPRGAENVDAARQFIDWMLRPANIAEASNFTRSMNAVAASLPLLDRHLRDNPAVNMPADEAGRLRPRVACPDEARALRRDVWSRVIAADGR